MPNPGRMEELLFKDSTVYLIPMDTSRVKYPYKVVGISSNHGSLMLDTIKNNEVAEYLINNHKIPSLNNYTIVRREVKYGNSRFDMLLTDGVNEIFCEIKSCTLFGGDIAMFPDAITERGRRHISELSEVSILRNKKQVVLFIVHSSKVDRFIPNYHTDVSFSEELYNSRDNLNIIPISIEWNNRLQLSNKIEEIPIDWSSYSINSRNEKGAYIIGLFLDQQISCESNFIDQKILKSGFYFFIGKSNSSIRDFIKRHKSTRKNELSDIDYLRNRTSIIGTWPIISTQDIHSFITKSFESISNARIINSDIFYFSSNPIRTRDFQDVIIKYRMEII